MEGIEEVLDQFTKLVGAKVRDASHRTGGTWERNIEGVRRAYALAFLVSGGRLDWRKLVKLHSDDKEAWKDALKSFQVEMKAEDAERILGLPFDRMSEGDLKNACGQGKVRMRFKVLQDKVIFYLSWRTAFGEDPLSSPKADDVPSFFEEGTWEGYLAKVSLLAGIPEEKVSLLFGTEALAFAKKAVPMKEEKEEEATPPPAPVKEEPKEETKSPPAPAPTKKKEEATSPPPSKEKRK